MSDRKQILIKNQRAVSYHGDKCYEIIVKMEKLRVQIQEEQNNLKELQVQMQVEKIKLEKEENEFSKYFHLLDFSEMKNLPSDNLLFGEWIVKLHNRLEELEKSEGQQAEDVDIPINT